MALREAVDRIADDIDADITEVGFRDIEADDLSAESRVEGYVRSLRAALASSRCPDDATPRDAVAVVAGQIAEGIGDSPDDDLLAVAAARGYLRLLRLALAVVPQAAQPVGRIVTTPEAG